MKKIEELLTGREVVTLPVTANAFEAAQSMRDHRCGAVLVVDAEGSPVGMFTERDLMLRVVVEGLDPAAERIGDHMTRDVFTVSPERRVSDAAQEMQARHIRHLPVVRGAEVLGLLSLRDLLREMLRAKGDEVQALTAYIQGDAEGSTDS